MGSTWYIFAHPDFFNAKSLCTLPRSAALARLNSTPMTVRSVSSSVRRPSVSATKSPKGEACPSQTSELQVHLVHISPLCAFCVGRICAAMSKFDPLVLTELVGESRCSAPVQKQGEEQDSPQRVLAGNHKED